MLRQVCKGKLHRATVTEADLNYMGSITIDPVLMTAANIFPYEMVQITNVSNGIIWHTYALAGVANAGTICLNGPPARHFQPGDQIIVLSLGLATEEEWPSIETNVVFLDTNNQIAAIETHALGTSAFTNV